MKKRPRLSDIFSLQPTIEYDSVGGKSLGEHAAQWQKIKFDNTIRVWIALPTYLACSVLWYQGFISSLLPMTAIFTVYGLLQLSISWFLMKSKHGRKLDFVFSTFDLLAMSFAVFFTGGVDSPLYFIYFIPLVVHVFHRDMGVVVFSGFGGVVLYALAVSLSLTEKTTALITNLSARLFFMLLTVSIACMALAILRKQDALERGRIRRLKNLTLISEALNHMTTLAERSDLSVLLIRLINEALGENLKPSASFFTTETECPTENFLSGSHVCLPVAGAENEVFGVLFVGSPIPNAFKADEMQFLEFSAKSLGLSIQRLNRMEELRKSLEMNSWVMATAIASTRSTNNTFQTVMDGITAILTTEFVEISLCRPETEEMQIVVQRGKVGGEERTLIFPLRKLNGKSLGCIRASRVDEGLKFSAIEVETAATFCSRAALSIENALVHEGQRKKIESYQGEEERKKAA